jgi:hypothetical protein
MMAKTSKRWMYHPTALKAKRPMAQPTRRIMPINTRRSMMILRDEIEKSEVCEVNFGRVWCLCLSFGG